MDLIEKEVLEVLRSFHDHKVKYILVGGFAVNYYGFNRTTADLDLWIEIEANNKENLIRALDSLGYDTDEITRVDLSGQPPIDVPLAGFKIELINYLGEKVSFKDAYNSATEMNLEGIPIKVLHINHLIQLKEGSNRPKDLIDVEELKKIREQRKNG